jgi:phosphoserine aminotransferase
MSSDYLSRPIPWERFDVVYGGAQKNLGPAGLTIVFVRASVLAETARNLASYLRWDVHAGSRSLYNTPPVFAIYMMGKTLQWIEDGGGLAAMETAAVARAGLLYRTIDESDGYYRSPVEPADRSLMNVVFRLPDEDAEERFLVGAEQRHLLNLKGHRSVGGIRASLYNAMPMSGVEALTSFMDSFR